MLSSVVSFSLRSVSFVRRSYIFVTKSITWSVKTREFSKWSSSAPRRAFEIRTWNLFGTKKTEGLAIRVQIVTTNEDDLREDRVTYAQAYLTEEPCALRRTSRARYDARANGHCNFTSIEFCASSIVFPLSPSRWIARDFIRLELRIRVDEPGVFNENRRKRGRKEETVSRRKRMENTLRRVYVPHFALYLSRI